MLFIAWIYGEQNQVRPMFPPNTSQADLIQASKLFDLAPQMPPVDWSKALTHLPVMDIIKSVDGPTGIFADRVEVSTGGAMIKRTPNDPAWYRGGLWHDDMKINVPGFWFMSWYDVSVGPNLAAYNFVRKTARPEIADAAVRGDRADAALRLHARDRKYHGRRARYGRCAAGLRRADLRLVRPFPEGRGQPDLTEDAQGSVLHDGDEQVADVGHVAAGGRAADDAVSGERRQGEHA